MKKVLLLMVAVLMVSSVAMADHIGVYLDANGSSCLLAAGFNPTVYVLEKFSLGSTGCRFAVNMGSSSQFGFTSPYPAIGTITSDISLAFGVCLSGTINLGTLACLLSPGSIQVTPASGFPNPIFTDCSFASLPATGGTAWVGSTGNCGEVATEPSTWGQVKALYR